MEKVNFRDRIANFIGRRIKNVKSGRFGHERFLLTRFVYNILPILGYDYSRGREWEFVLKNLVLPPVRLLDVGTTNSLLIYEFAKRGYDTYGLDYNAYEEKLPSDIKFIQCDILHTPFPDNFFDYITAISFIEHVGIGYYGDPQIREGGDLMAIREMHRIIKSNGLLLLTTPSKEWLVKNQTDSTQRGYTDETIDNLIDGYFTILKKECKMGQFLLKLQRI